MIVRGILAGVDLAPHIIHGSVEIRFTTEDEDHHFGMTSVKMRLSNMDGVTAGVLGKEGYTSTLSVGPYSLEIVLDATHADPDREEIELSMLAKDRHVMDQLKNLKIIDFAQDYHGLWTLFEGAAQYRVYTAIHDILERALNSIGLSLELDIRILQGKTAVLGGLSPTYALGVQPPTLLIDLPIVGAIYLPQLPILPDWTVTELLEEISSLFNAYWTVQNGVLTVRDVLSWQNVIGPGIPVPLTKDSLKIEYGQGQLSRVELTFSNAIPAPRQAPSRTNGESYSAMGGGAEKKIESKFSLPYALVYDYAGAPTGGVAVIPKDVESNTFLILSEGEAWDKQFNSGAQYFLESYLVALKEVGTAKAQVSVMDDPELITELAKPYRTLRLPELYGYTVCVKEATFDPHEETIDFSAGIYTGLPQ